MRKRRWVGRGLWMVLASFSVTPVVAQETRGMPRGPELPMHPQYERGQPVSPIFEGWYENPDGTYTLSFGYFNRNSQEVLEIPIGPDNFVEPAEYNGNQPTSFRAGMAYAARGWGLFNVVVPATFTPNDRVVWTLRSKGRTHSVPGKVGNREYQLAPVDQPAGVGSKAPRIRFEANGPETAGRIGLWARETLKATVGAPLTLTVWAADDFEPSLRGPAPVNLTWSKYQGPPEGMVVFAGGEAGEGTRGGPARAGPAAGAPGPVGRGGFGGGGGSGLRAPAEGGEVSTTATFSAPGDYVLRVEALASGRDSSNADQCCWTNGYVRVTVTP